MESGVNLKSVNKGWGKAPKSVMRSVGMGVVDGERREVGQTEDGEPENGKRLNLYVL